VTQQPYEPIQISAEHGDGLPDLFQKLRAHIPKVKEEQYVERKSKRVERYAHYKQMLLDEIV
jgi:predicted GTPase